MQRHNEMSEEKKRIFISALNFLWKYQPSLLEWNDLQLDMRALSCPESDFNVPHQNQERSPANVGCGTFLT